MTYPEQLHLGPGGWRRAGHTPAVVGPAPHFGRCVQVSNRRLC